MTKNRKQIYTDLADESRFTISYNLQFYFLINFLLIIDPLSGLILRI